jgi:CBS domain-containing protein/ribosome-associated translation inhibitor RaiA
MEIKDFLKKPLVFNSEENVAHVISKMSEEKRYEALIFDENFLGIVSAKDLLKSPLNNPQKTKIVDFVSKIKPRPINSPIQDLIRYILANDYKEIPIECENEIMMIQKIDLLRFLNKELISEKEAKDVMIYPYSVNSKNNLAEVKSMMKNLNITTMPVIDEKGRLEGVIDILDILNAVVNKERMRLGEMVGEKIAQEKVLITSFMKKDVVKVPEEEKIKKVIDMMLDKKESTIFVEKNGKITGMITIKNILKLIENPIEDVYIHISGFDCIEDDFAKSIIKKEIENSLKKLKKITPINYFAIHIEKHTKGGKRAKYSVKGRIVTHHKTIAIEDYEWDVIKAMKIFLDKMERKILRNKAKY